VSTAQIVGDDGNEHLAQLVWNAERVEVMYIDCGRTCEVNEAWYKIFSSNFIPGMTLLIMQDWGLRRERPRREYNQTLRFTNAHPEMKLVHELSGGSIATFLFTAP
jgi:hypothetical protein